MPDLAPLTRHPRFDGRPGPVVLVILDGVGVGLPDEYNAVHVAKMPTLRGLLERWPHRTLRAHGAAVGLPSDDDMGNSEVGHNALGAGRIFPQGAKLVNQALDSGALFEGASWRWLIEGAQAGGTLHLLGLLSDGNVHSHIQHLFALLRRADAEGVQRVRLHVLLDGRDVPARSAEVYVAQTEALLAEISRRPGRDYAIASGGGRMVITMDRYNADWAMVARGWAHHVRGEGRAFPSAMDAVNTLRAETGKDDQNLPPFVIHRDGAPLGPIRDGDSVLLFNFRGDRAIEISRAFEEGPAFSAFDRGARPQVRYAGMMEYDGDLHVPGRYLVSPPAIDATLGEHLAATGVPQLACAETQKYGHVTYFFNGNRSNKFNEALETWIEVPSDNVPFEQRPWMKAAEVTDATLAGLTSSRARFARVNYANGDMVGHTGDLRATVMAMEALDLCLGRLVAGVAAVGGIVVLTADHGNADEMVQRDKKGGPQRGPDGAPLVKSSHTLNPVPLVIVDPSYQGEYTLREDLPHAGLANLAATLIELLGYSPPAGYEPSLLRFC